MDPLQSLMSVGLDCGYNQNRKPGLQPGYVAQLQNRIGILIVSCSYCLVELETLLEQQSQALRIQAAAPPRPTQFEERRQSIQSTQSHNYSLPPIQPQPRYPYVSTCSPTDRRSSYDEKPTSARSRDATALEHLAHAAATSPPATDRRSPASDIDPNLGFAAVSFPTFPHDIFISNTQSYATPTRETEIEFTALDRNTGAVVPFGPEADGFPPKEILEIMFVRQPLF